MDDLAGDVRFANNPSRVEHRDALSERLGERTAAFTTAALFDRLREFGVPAAPVQTVPEVVADPQVQESGMLRPAPHEGRDDHWETVLPLRFDGARLPPRPPPPKRPTE